MYPTQTDAVIYEHVLRKWIPGKQETPIKRRQTRFN